MFRSKLEEKVADLLFELNIDYEYESTKLCYVIQHHYSPDFILPNGRILECKGYWDSADRRKIRAVIKDNPDIDLRMVFQGQCYIPVHGCLMHHKVLSHALDCFYQSNHLKQVYNTGYSF